MLIEIATWTMYFVSTYFAVFLLLIVLEKGIDTSKRTTRWKPFVTVAIPAYNEEKTLKATVESVYGLDYPHDKLEVIVVNDCSNDQTASILNKLAFFYRDKHFRVIHHQSNKGKGAALNTALDVARGEIFACLDADSFVQPDALLKMLPHFEHSPNVASVLPFIKITTTHNLLLKIQWVEYLMNFFLKKISGSIDCIHVTPGPFGCYRKDILKKVGGFDTNNLTEDLEMAIKLQSHNYKIVQVLDAEVYTVPPLTLRNFYKQRNRWYKGTLHNLRKYRHLIFSKHYGEFGMFHLPMVLISAVLSLSFAFLIIFYRLIRPVLIRLYDLSFIDFDFPLVMRLAAERFHLLDFNYVMLYMTVLVFGFALMWIVGSHYYGKENYLKKGLFPSVIFLAVYPLLLSAIWAGVFFDLVRKKKQKW